ncbi:MAG: hypothetical protein D4S01_06350 [Dehalococcoidia bacterium]|nr:MAG: hypothetical protein D4S01_06350 [Dehalococcoidia bacterium]
MDWKTPIDSRGRPMQNKNGQWMCMECREKPQASELGIEFHGCTFFCTEECRDIWNDNHPNETIFRTKQVVETKKYCNKCNRLMTERFTLEKGSEWFCKKCEAENEQK